MAWDAGRRIGFEHADDAEYENIGGFASFAVSDTKAKSGDYSLRSSIFDGACGVTFASTNMMRIGVWLNHNGLFFDGSVPWVFVWKGASGNDALQWTHPANTLNLRINSSLVASVPEATGGFTATDTWRHIAVNVFADSSVGWASVYIDGVKIMTATGLNTGTGITYAGVGWYVTAGWKDYAYFDDFYVDTSTIEEEDSAPPQKLLLWRLPNGAGSHTEWTPSAGANFENVDESGTNDGDTTYNSATSAGLQDAYATDDLALPYGYQIIAQIASSIDKRTSNTETIRVGFTDGVNDDLSDAQSSSVAYGIHQARFTTRPDGGVWDQATGNSTEVLIESAGTY